MLNVTEIQTELEKTYFEQSVVAFSSSLEYVQSINYQKVVVKGVEVFYTMASPLKKGMKPLVVWGYDGKDEK